MSWRHEIKIEKFFNQKTGAPLESRTDWIKCGNKSIALTVADFDNPEFAEKNAALIAAAPDLLKAITYYFDVLEEVQGASWNKNPDHVLEKMLNAVAKAKALREPVVKYDHMKQEGA